MLITIKELLEEIANPKPKIIDKEKYAFPTNGVQRETCRKYILNELREQHGEKD